MLALVFDPSPERLPLAAAAARIPPGLRLRGPSLLSLQEIPRTRSPRPDWALLRVVRTGICGSDLKEVRLQASSDNPLSGLVSFPHVPGHEILARVIEPGGSDLVPGTLVAVDPWLGCRARGLWPLCPACRGGFAPHCGAVGEGGPWGTGQGMHLGTVRGLPGGFAQIISAHPTQLHRLPLGLRPGLVVLADPLAVGLHAVERVGGTNPEVVLVIGAGTIGLGLTLAARTLWPTAQVMVTSAWAHQRELVSELGARPIPAAPRAAVGEVSAITGARLARPWRGGPWTLAGGVELVLDSIGSAATLELGLRCLAPRGRIVEVGVARPARQESTLIYYKEATVMGSNGYGTSGLGDRPHLLDVALGLLARQASAERWLTHSLPIARWREAFAAAARPDRSGAIKVSLELEEGPIG